MESSYRFRTLSAMASFLFVVFLLQSSLLVLGYKLKDVEVMLEINGKPAEIFSARKIAQYDGSNSARPLYMGVKGVVFDVSKGKDFYGKGSAYNSLIGMDCSKAVAKMSLEEEDLTHDISDLSDDHLKALDDVFDGTYMAKYPVVGYMDFLKEQFPEKFVQAAPKEDL
ncbi:neudesin-like [Haliotis rufescens]|uniref:neudesin-like n=1 Tax=Haliotis rufescens TaxID=6454 RepID=UPI001EAFE385|nr:neudesin-like [Haliotis rufescens]